MNRPDIQPSMTLEQIIVLLSEGVTAVQEFLTNIMKDDRISSSKKLGVLLDLEDMGMRGLQIASAIDWHTRYGNSSFLQSCEDRHPDMVFYVNRPDNRYPEGTPTAFCNSAKRRNREAKMTEREKSRSFRADITGFDRGARVRRRT